jgi:hypothetical protein
MDGASMTTFPFFLLHHAHLMTTLPFFYRTRREKTLSLGNQKRET